MLKKELPMLSGKNTEHIFFNILLSGVFIIAFLPLFVNHNYLFPFVFPKTVLFRIIIEIMLVFYIPLAITNKKYRPKMTGIFWSLFAFLAVIILASVFGADIQRSFWSTIERSEGILTWLHLFAFFIMLSSILQTEKLWDKFFYFVLVAGWVQALYALSQHYNLSFALKTTGTRINGTLGNPSFFASYLIFIIFIALYIYAKKSGIVIKALSLSLALISVFLLWQTQTRGAIIACVAGLLLLVFLKPPLRDRKKRKVLVYSLLAVVILFTAFLFTQKNAPWVENQETLNRIVNISAGDITAQNRLIVWGVGMKGFFARPVLGWGWENFYVPFNKYFNPAITRDIGSRPWYDRAHNVLVETAATTGILGVIAYLFIFASAGYLMLKYWRKEKEIIFLPLLIAYFLQNLFVFDTLSSYIMFFAVLAFIGANVQKNEENKQKRGHPSIVIFFTVIVAILPLAYFWNIRPLFANKFTVQAIRENREDPLLLKGGFEKAFRYAPPRNQELRFIAIQYTREQLSLRGINEKTLDLLEFSINEMRKSITAAPYMVQNSHLLAEMLIQTQISEYLLLAELVVNDAMEKSPQRYQSFFLLGRIRMSQGRFEEGIEYFKNAVALNENFAEAHWNLAIAYILSGKHEFAGAELEKADSQYFKVYTDENINKLTKAYVDSKNIDATIRFYETLIERFPENNEYQSDLKELKNIRASIQ